MDIFLLAIYQDEEYTYTLFCDGCRMAVLGYDSPKLQLEARCECMRAGNSRTYLTRNPR